MVRNAGLSMFPCESLLPHFSRRELSDRMLDDNVCSFQRIKERLEQVRALLVRARGTTGCKQSLVSTLPLV